MIKELASIVSPSYVKSSQQSCSLKPKPNHTLKQIAHCNNVSVHNLLQAPPFNIKMDNYHVVTEVTTPK